MKLAFSIKALGKKRPYIDKKEIELDIESSILMSDLLAKIVQQQVSAFNKRKEETTLLQVLSEKQIQHTAESGKVTFNEQYNLTKAEEEKAIETVWRAFEDGLIAFFINDIQQESMDEMITIQELDSIMIIRLTFLSGSIW